MSIEKELERLFNAKNAIKEAIRSKNVQVDDADSIDKYADYIKQIVVCEPQIPSDEIWYITNDGLTAQTTISSGITSLETMGLISNTYEDGKGVMKFSRDVTSIGEHAFFSCSRIISIIIPDTVTSIDDNAFDACKNLTSITIPNSVETIGNSAFAVCTSITSVEIPELVTSIGNSTFSGCKSLIGVVIPKSVTSIGANAFKNCSSLARITYNGTIEEWNAITKGYYWKDYVPTTCIVHCTDGNINI